MFLLSDTLNMSTLSIDTIPCIEFECEPYEGTVMLAIQGDVLQDFPFTYTALNEINGYATSLNYISVNTIDKESLWAEAEALDIEGKYGTVSVMLYHVTTDVEYNFLSEQLQGANIFLTEVLFSNHNIINPELVVCGKPEQTYTQGDGVAVNPSYDAIQVAVFIDKELDARKIFFVVQEI